MTVFEYYELDYATDPPKREQYPAFGFTVHPYSWIVFQEMNPICLYW